jgi:hypothetical protein
VARRRSAALLAALVVAAGCRHAVPPSAPLPAGWQALVVAPRAFSALYRFSCCGHRGLVLTVRGDGESLALSVAVPPGGTALAAWVGPGGGFVERVKQGCREALPPGVLPLAAGASLPIDPALAALLLSGLLPAGTRELPELPGWVEAASGGLAWRARVTGPEPHWTQVLLTRVGDATPAMSVVRTDEGGRVPHRLVLTAGTVEADLDLQAWRPSGAPAPPAWLTAPECGARP